MWQITLPEIITVLIPFGPRLRDTDANWAEGIIARAHICHLIALRQFEVFKFKYIS